MMYIEPDRREIFCYMGCREKDCSEELLGQVENAIAQLKPVLAPKWTWQKFDIDWHGSDHNRNDHTFDIGSMHVASKNLSVNLRGCNSCYLMAATLGLGPDHLIKRIQFKNMALALIYQAVCAAMTENLCNQINEEIICLEKEKGNYCRPRFSPGYGDFDISHQKDFEDLLQMSKRTGINLTKSYMMMPSKSVTAVIGISATDSKCILAGCEACSKTDCAYRRNRES